VTLLPSSENCRGKHLRCISVRSRNVPEGFRTIADPCGALRKDCGPLECFRTTAMHYSSAPCGGVHESQSHTKPLTIMAVHRGNITESLRTTATLADHCGALPTPYCPSACSPTFKLLATPVFKCSVCGASHGPSAYAELLI